MPLETDTINTIKTTVPILEEYGPTITKVFYENMFHHHPELLNIFNKANQNIGQQQVALANMVYEAAKNIDRLDILLEDVKLIAHKHRSLHVRPEHYPIVGKYLLLAIKEVLGDTATEEIMNAWEEAYGAIAQVFIDVEKEMYEEAAEQVGGWEGFKDFIVVDKVKESDVITSFYLEAKDGNVLPIYKPGQYLTVRVTIPGNEFMQIRHYTLSSASNTKQYRISVKKEADCTPNGVVSTYLHNQLEVNDIIEASAPAGTFTLENEANPVAFISGGVGITPMISMLETLSTQNSDGDVSFIHATQSESVHAFHAHVEEIVQHMPNARYIYGYSDPFDPLGDQHFNGYVTKETLDKVMKSNTIFYIVGPVPFMEHVATLLANLNVDENNIRYELFGPAQDIKKKTAVQA